MMSMFGAETCPKCKTEGVYAYVEAIKDEGIEIWACDSCRYMGEKPI